MQLLIEFRWWLLAMAALVCASAFFSGSEAALFYLSRKDREKFRRGRAAQRVATALLDQPDRLLTAVLFWNLFVNVTYFAISSVISIELESERRHYEAGTFALGSLMVLILCGEMLPKSLAVLRTRAVAALVAVPMAVGVRAFAPLDPIFRGVILISRRMIFPNLQPEPALEVADLERAIHLSTSDAALLDQEQAVLTNIVSLSDIRVDELMRPRTRFLSFTAPVSIEDLQGRVPPGGYVLLTEPDSEEIAAAIAVRYLSDIPGEHLELHAVPVINVPWCTSVAQALEQIRGSKGRVAAVINELGETIGVLTLEDILATVFTPTGSRSERMLRTTSIHQARPGVWHVTGMTSLRRIKKLFDVELPETQGVTVAGVLQEVLQRLPAEGDQCEWGPFHWRVLAAPERGQLSVEITALPPVEVP